MAKFANLSHLQNIVHPSLDLKYQRKGHDFAVVFEGRVIWNWATKDVYPWDWASGTHAVEQAITRYLNTSVEDLRFAAPQREPRKANSWWNPPSDDPPLRNLNSFYDIMRAADKRIGRGYLLPTIITHAQQPCAYIISKRLKKKRASI